MKTCIKLYNAVCRTKLDYVCQIYSLACKTKLKEVDVVHNLGFRIGHVAYRTSIESIYIESNQLPLDLRREALVLPYVQRLKSSPNNPAYKVLAYCDSEMVLSWL